MNDRHPSGTTSPTPAPGADYASPTAYTPQGSDGYGYRYQDSPAQAPFTGGQTYDAYSAYPAAPYAGPVQAPAQDGPTGHPVSGNHHSPYEQSPYDTGAFATGTYPSVSYDSGTYDTGTYASHPYETGTYDTAPHSTGAYDAGSYETGSYPAGSYGTTSYETGSFATGGWPAGGQAAGFQQETPAPGLYDTGGCDTGSLNTGGSDTGSFDSGQWNLPSQAQYDTLGGHGVGPGGYATGSLPQQPLAGVPAQSPPTHSGQWDTRTWEPAHRAHPEDDTPETHTAQMPVVPPSGPARTAAGPHDEGGAGEAGDASRRTAEDVHSRSADDTPGGTAAPDASARPSLPASFVPAGPAASTAPSAGETAGPVVVGGEAEQPGRGRNRRRMPAKRSALLTIAVPSACVMGVAGVAAASVGDFGGDGKETGASSSPEPVRPAVANNKLDTQLAKLSAAADDVADRASRTQERIDLKAKKEAAHKAAVAEAARKERERPKFAMPVTQHGLSAYFGQAGVNWMSQHTGIDFPVSYGTAVMAATDGTVRSQWNSAYGNMAIVTAKDGTETWYCHLSGTTVPSGTAVKAGDVIARSGNSGNSTGPHMHFEVRPGAGAAIDPLPWLRSHGIDPT
ncbi:peptidoglycan DD-metalloendopeptidase family protein [Streptomyces sp. NPDC049954]|uniref:peptidoglycan DD-metalloendopeptidase family protein n=1 Tax=Streptomyces sp. NPDC049954 TaxID=3155779 RepID=UPI00343CF6B6